MKRKLFCEISPFTYRLSVEKEILKRHLRDFIGKTPFAHERTEEPLPVLVYSHNSLIRRRLGNVNMQLQENKAVNLALAVKHIDGLLIRRVRRSRYGDRWGVPPNGKVTKRD